MDYKDKLREAVEELNEILHNSEKSFNDNNWEVWFPFKKKIALQRIISFAQKGIEEEVEKLPKPGFAIPVDKPPNKITKEELKMYMNGFNQACDLHLPILTMKDKQIEELKKNIIKEFEDKLDANNPNGFRYSTRVEPRLADAEKVKEWLEQTLNQKEGL